MDEMAHQVLHSVVLQKRKEKRSANTSVRGRLRADEDLTGVILLALQLLDDCRTGLKSSSCKGASGILGLTLRAGVSKVS